VHMMILRFLGFLLAVGLFILSVFQKKFRKGKKAGLVIASFVLTAFMARLVLFPFIPAPRPTGPYAVLTEKAFYQYTTGLPHMATDGNEREIPAKIWRPKDAREQSHPLFLFSPGSFGVAESNETLFLELASRGYIVVSLNHPYHSFLSEMSDGRKIDSDSAFIKSAMSSRGAEDLRNNLNALREWSAVRINDISAVLDRIADPQAEYPYEQYIDPERIILSGHSLGGSAALAVGRERSKDIKALVILEAPFASDIVGIDGEQYVFTDERYPLPVLHIYSDALFSRMDDIATYGMNVRLMNSDDPMYVNKHIPGVGHLGLTDMSLATPVITYLMDSGLDTRPAPEALLELNGYVLEFLNTYGE
jgi:dienelactone hydrolase